MHAENRPTCVTLWQEAYERLDAREAKARQAEADLADARTAAQVIGWSISWSAGCLHRQFVL